MTEEKTLLSAKKFGKYIREQRREASIGLAELSRRTEIPEETLKQYEAGTIEISSEDLDKVAKAFGVTVPCLLNYELYCPAPQTPLKPPLFCDEEYAQKRQDYIEFWNNYYALPDNVRYALQIFIRMISKHL